MAGRGGALLLPLPPPPRPPSHVFDSDAILSAAQKLAIDGTKVYVIYVSYIC